MNPFSDFHPNEEILRQERLHAGIFALPVVLFVAFLIPTIPVLFFLNMMGSMIGQLNPQGPRSSLSILWVVLVAMDLLPALLYFIVILLAYQNSELTLTNKHLIYRTGFVARAAGTKKTEYLARTPYWRTRLEGRRYDVINFRNGYGFKPVNIIMKVILASLMGMLAGTLVLAGSPAAIRLEAEDATLVGTAVATGRPGFSGKGYVSGMDKKTDKIIFKVHVPAGFYNVALRYSSPFGNKGYVLDIGGQKRSGMFPPTENVFATHQAGIVEFPDAEIPVAIEYGWGYYDIDYLELTPAESPKPPVKPPAKLADPQATKPARDLMARLVEHYGAGTFSGVQSAADLDYVRKVAGRTPAILGDDLMEYSPSRIENGANPNNLSEKMIEASKQGRILTLMWHWNAPSGLGKSTTNAQGKVSTELWWSGFYTKATSFDVKQALADPQSAGYRLLLRDIDAIAAQLKKFSDASIPVLWRPLHEAEGGWFWWGAKGQEPFVQLWRLMHERLTQHHALHNLIWVYTESANLQWYPGDDCVDIIGLDAYPEDRRDPLSSDWGILQQRFAGKKLLALTEFGGVPDIERMHRLGVWWSYFVPWTEKMGPRGMSPEDVTRIYRLPGVLDGDQKSK